MRCFFCRGKTVFPPQATLLIAVAIDGGGIALEIAFGRLDMSHQIYLALA